MFLKLKAGGDQNFPEERVNNTFFNIDLPQHKVFANARFPLSWQPATMFHNLLTGAHTTDYGYG